MGLKKRGEFHGYGCELDYLEHCSHCGRRMAVYRTWIVSNTNLERILELCSDCYVLPPEALMGPLAKAR